MKIKNYKLFFENLDTVKSDFEIKASKYNL